MRLAQRQAAACRRELRRAEWFEQLRAKQAVERARLVVQAKSATVRFDIDRKPLSHVALLECLWDLDDAKLSRNRLEKGIGPLELGTSPVMRRSGALLVSHLRRLPRGLLARVEHDLGVLESNAVRPEFQDAAALADELSTVHFLRRPDAAGLWRWYETDAASVYAMLERAHEIAQLRPSMRQRVEWLSALRLGDIAMLAGRGIGIAASAATTAIVTAIRQSRSSTAPTTRTSSGQENRSGRQPARSPVQRQPRQLMSRNAAELADNRSKGEHRAARTRTRVETGNAYHGFVPERLARMVEEQLLNTSSLNVTLRGYQAFGARYALLQRRVLLGDEMGLGKTIVALAVMTHLAEEEDARHFLVVAPNSVLFNWRHEVELRTSMSAHVLHGTSVMRQSHDWRRSGGVAITTFGTLHKVGLPDGQLPLLVIDEAHYVKNPKTKRSQNVVSIMPTVDRVMFMTGTPLENRLSEFHILASTLNPDALRRIPDLDGYPSDQFRAAAAPVYLRRNQEDVLPELPETIEVDEWVKPTSDDEARFDAILASGGNFTHLRYCAFPTRVGSEKSAKLERLAELVADAMDDGLKVVVFAEYHATLNAVMNRLAVPTFGPIIGAVAGKRRFEIIREFTDHEGGAVLISQIQAGGIGLNIQAASVVILCEPALKPSTEEQAIARAARMGQTRHVRVHRLLSVDGIDRRIVDLLAKKRQIFDDYARHSALAEVSEAAMERELVSELRDYVAEESRRRGLAV